MSEEETTLINVEELFDSLGPKEPLPHPASFIDREPKPLPPKWTPEWRMSWAWCYRRRHKIDPLYTHAQLLDLAAKTDSPSEMMDLADRAMENFSLQTEFSMLRYLDAVQTIERAAARNKLQV